MTNEQILLPVVPYSGGCECPLQIDRYRGIVEETVFQAIGRPVFFAEAVEMVMGRIAARVQRLDPGPETSAEAILAVIENEARELCREMEARFMATGKLELPPGLCTG